MRSGDAAAVRGDAPNRLRPKISLTLDPQLLAWIDNNVGTGRYFKSRSDAVDWCLKDVKARRGNRMKLEA
jgi:Arc/MetJ-type ribon-helix-helix transcriptional regulator